MPRKPKAKCTPEEWAQSLARQAQYRLQYKRADKPRKTKAECTSEEWAHRLQLDAAKRARRRERIGVEELRRRDRERRANNPEAYKAISRRASRKYYATHIKKELQRVDRVRRTKTKAPTVRAPIGERLQNALRGNALYSAVIAAIPASLPSHVRDDAAQSLILDVLEGKIAEADISKAARHAINDAYGDTFRCLSLDAVIPDTDGLRYIGIFHPVCRYLTNSGAKHLYLGMRKENGINPERWVNMEAGAAFFLRLWNAPIPRVAVENPIMHGHAQRIIGAKPTQIIQPWMFGHPETKATCLWLRNLPPLEEPDNVYDAMMALPIAQRARVHHTPPGPNREADRSRTLPGIGAAMAKFWGGTRHAVHPPQIEMELSNA